MHVSDIINHGLKQKNTYTRDILAANSLLSAIVTSNLSNTEAVAVKVGEQGKGYIKAKEAGE